jgi:multisubunit Na+/H+ antiporter MnhG subunit
MKPLFKIFIVVFVCTILLAAFGIMKYPDAPVRQYAFGYFDKRFNFYSEVDYRNFKIWESLLLLASLATALSAAVCLIARRATTASVKK